jgi:hypothetical protein
MQTIRLEKALLPPGATLEWNILDEAKEKGLVHVWAEAEEKELGEEAEKGIANGDAVGMEGDLGGQGGPLGGTGIFGLDGELSPEEIARRYEEKYDKPRKKSKVGVLRPSRIFLSIMTRRSCVVHP